MPTLAVERTRNGVLTSAESATLQVLTVAGTEALVPTLVLPHAPGRYSYTIDTLQPGSYSAIWTFTNVGYVDDVVSRLFTLDPAQAIPDGVTLMAIERKVARRIGPYYQVTAQEGSTIARLYNRRFKSQLVMGSYEDLYILRRGVTTGMNFIPDFVKDDRIRMVSRYDNSTGFLFADDLWDKSPDAPRSEYVELLYLDPDLELRPSALDGLKRCYFWDTIQMAGTTTLAASVNVSLTAPWITSPSQIREVSTQLGVGSLPQPLSWWRARRSGPHVHVQHQGAGSAGLTLDVLRPVSSLVNAELSLTGPNDDLDIVYVDPDYAAWSIIMELWKNCPERLQPLVHEQLRPSREEAAAEFTKQSLLVANQLPDTFRVAFGGMQYQQIGNLPEPVV